MGAFGEGRYCFFFYFLNHKPSFSFPTYVVVKWMWARLMFSMVPLCSPNVLSSVPAVQRCVLSCRYLNKIPTHDYICESLRTPYFRSNAYMGDRIRARRHIHVGRGKFVWRLAAHSSLGDIAIVLVPDIFCCCWAMQTPHNQTSLSNYKSNNNSNNKNTWSKLKPHALAGPFSGM